MAAGRLPPHGRLCCLLYTGHQGVRTLSCFASPVSWTAMGGVVVDLPPSLCPLSVWESCWWGFVCQRTLSTSLQKGLWAVEAATAMGGVVVDLPPSRCPLTVWESCWWGSVCQRTLSTSLQKGLCAVWAEVQVGCCGRCSKGRLHSNLMWWVFGSNLDRH